MDYNDKVRWLRRYLDAQRKERVLAEEVERLRAEAERVTPLLTCEEPIISGEVYAAQKALAEQILQCLEVRHAVKQAIEAVSDMRWQEILYRRHILGQTLEYIAQEMNYDYRWVKRLYRQAVENFDIHSMEA